MVKNATKKNLVILFLGISLFSFAALFKGRALGQDIDILLILGFLLSSVVFGVVLVVLNKKD